MGVHVKNQNRSDYCNITSLKFKKLANEANSWISHFCIDYLTEASLYKYRYKKIYIILAQVH
jgi:hypothetical protein